LIDNGSRCGFHEPRSDIWVISEFDTLWVSADCPRKSVSSAIGFECKGPFGLFRIVGGRNFGIWDAEMQTVCLKRQSKPKCAS
jgi:hypothetical protein